MTFYDKSAQHTCKTLGTDISDGLTLKAVSSNKEKYGENVLSKKKKQGFWARFFCALKEPMLIILLFGFVLAFGTAFGKFLKTGESDFTECLGILFAVLLSVSITLIMEGSSERAFAALTKIYGSSAVKVLRKGNIVFIPQNEIVVGDIVFLETGDKIIADGRLIESDALSVDESALTGESNSVNKNSEIILNLSTPLAERINCVYSGTFVTAGKGKMVVTAVGDKTEMGSIANSLSDTDQNSPLQQKLGKLGKTITIIGAVVSTLVFVVSVLRLYLQGGLDFSSVQELFISSIVLIIAAVPEGLPTIVAVSLALNMIKLAKENALIKKITATETAGAVSVICTDKTGTLTQNKMEVISVCKNEFCSLPENISDLALQQNFVCNSTAELKVKEGRYIYKGSATEGALLVAYQKNSKIPYLQLRQQFEVVDITPFSSDNKYMSTTIKTNYGFRKLIKGAPEKILPLCELTDKQRGKIYQKIKENQQKARRVLCFAHLDFTDLESDKYVFDGFVAIVDPVRKEVYKAVSDCKRAGIKVKILTGDNKETALAVAKEVKIADSESQVINASELEKLDDKAFANALNKITVISRSTPAIKLRVVRALKNMGEVVAVTGDGVNDAPAIKNADVGIVMGVSGSEITKEAADIILTDDSFETVVKSISFGRNVYKNLQRFILFQLSVNLSALFFITFCAVTGMNTPFNTLQLLWINVIMDGPPALTLGLERANSSLMSNKPIKRSSGIVSVKMLLRILFNGFFIGAIMVAQYKFDFLRVGYNEKSGAIFTLFIFFQLLNAFNSRELGKESIFKSIGKNKIMVITFVLVMLIHVFIVQVCYKVFAVSPLSISTWIKTIALSVSIIVVSEIFKLIYRLFSKKDSEKTGNEIKCKNAVNKFYLGA